MEMIHPYMEVFVWVCGWWVGGCICVCVGGSEEEERGMIYPYIKLFGWVCGGCVGGWVCWWVGVLVGMAVSTENAAPPKSTKSRNKFLGTNSN